MNTCFEEKSPNGLLVGKILDVNMGHIQAKDAKLLGHDYEANTPTVIVYRKERGFFLHVDHAIVDIDERRFLEAGYSEEFIKIFHEALAAGASWISFDGDGAISGALPTFDW